jgi:hypothetical protein
MLWNSESWQKVFILTQGIFNLSLDPNNSKISAYILTGLETFLIFPWISQVI